MKRVISVIVAVLILSLPLVPVAFAEETPEEMFSIKVPDGGTTFKYLYNMYCKNMDSAQIKYIKELDPKTYDRSGGRIRDTYYYEWVVSADENSMQTVGYGLKNDKIEYLQRNIYCYHEHGETIRFSVFYYTDGQYFGNVKWDLTNDAATSSRNAPCYVEGASTSLE